MDISTATILMVGAIFALLVTGLPLAFITGLVAMAFTFGWFGEAALPLVTSRREHVVITLFDGLFGAIGLAVKSALMNLASAVVIAVLCWRLVGLALRFAEYGDRTTFLAAPLAPFAWFMVAAAGWTALILVSLAVRDMGQAISGSGTRAGTGGAGAA